MSGRSRAVGDPAHAAVMQFREAVRNLDADLYMYLYIDTLYVGIHTTVSDRRVLLTIRRDTLYGRRYGVHVCVAGGAGGDRAADRSRDPSR